MGVGVDRDIWIYIFVDVGISFFEIGEVVDKMQLKASEILANYSDKAEKKINRLKEMVKDAYREGWIDSRNTVNFSVSWKESNALKYLEE